MKEQSDNVSENMIPLLLSLSQDQIHQLGPYKKIFHKNLITLTLIQIQRAWYLCIIYHIASR